MAEQHDLVLYVKPGCPFCVKVQTYLRQSDIQIETRNVFEGDNWDDLVRIGGKDQAPCLIIDGAPLYESDDIIAWLKAHVAA